MLIEQAIFTSARTNRAAGYQLVARSAGITDADAREISVWGPSHDSLYEDGADAVSVNFFQLPSGAYCISKTEPAGGEYSGRRGAQIYTQCLVVSQDCLARFGNNPFAVLTAALAQGSLRIYEELPKELDAFRLPGRAAAVDQSVFPQLQSDPGPAWVARLLEHMIDGKPFAIVGHGQPACLLAGLINCLPPSCRTALSFTTGLKYSPRRPYRITCVPVHQPEQRRVLRQNEIELLDMSAERTPGLSVTRGWPGFVSCALAANKTSFFASRLGRLGAVTFPELARLGDELLEELAGHGAGSEESTLGFDEPPARFAPESPRETLDSGVQDATPTLAFERRADAPHDRGAARWSAAVTEATLMELASAPADTLGRDYPRAQEQLELLDDTVFEAIAGKPEAFDRLTSLWPSTVRTLGRADIETYREHYVRYAIRLWQDCAEGDEVRSPGVAVRALDAIAVFFRD